MDSQFSNCTSVDLKRINLVYCGTAAACCLVSAIILLLIFTHKAFNSVLQRLFLYLMVAIFLRELFMAASFEHHFRYDPNVQEKVCSGIGFMKNWMAILVFVFTVGMKVYLLLYVRHLTSGKPVPEKLHSKSVRGILETCFVVLAIIITFIYSTLPFYTNNYGLAGPVCWIRVLDANCTVTISGVVHQILNGYIFYLSGSIIGLVLLIGTIVLYCRLPMAYNNEKSRMLLKKCLSVILSFLLNIVIIVSALMARIFAVRDKQFNFEGLWYYFGVTFPISVLLFPTVYMVCFFRLNMCGLCQCNEPHHTSHRPEHKYRHSIDDTTVRGSSRFSAPSATFYESPYTDGFTDSQVTERERLIRAKEMDLAPGQYGTVNVVGVNT